MVPSKARRLAVIALSVAHILSGCKSSPSQKQDQPDRSTEAEFVVTDVTLQQGENWFAGDRSPQPFNIRIDVSGSKERILSSDGQGFILMSENKTSINEFQTGPILKLLYQNKQIGTYNLPPGYYSLLMIGPEHPCQPLKMYIPEGTQDGSGVAFDFEINVGADDSKLRMVRFEPSSSRSPTISNRRCGEKYADSVLSSDDTDELSLGEKIALGIVVAPLLVIAAPILLESLRYHPR